VSERFIPAAGRPSSKPRTRCETMRPKVFLFSSRRRHTIFSRDWSSDVCSSDLLHSNFFGERTLTARTLAASLVGSLARREPEDLAILNKYLHGVVEPRSKEEGGSWPEFLEGGRDAIATLS